MNRYYNIALIALLLTGCRKKDSADQQTTAAVFRPSKKIKDLTFEEALGAKTYYAQAGQSELAIQALERAVLLSNNTEQAEHLILELGDMLLAAGSYDKAQKIYREFKNFYPGSASLKYALYQEIMSHHLAALGTDRDQTTTRETVALAQDYLKRFEHRPADDALTPIVISALNSSYRALYEHELNQVDFYLNKFKYDHRQAPVVAASNRLDYLKNEVIPHLDMLDTQKLAKIDTIIQTALLTIHPSQDPADQKIELAQEELQSHVQKLEVACLSLRSLLRDEKGVDSLSKQHRRDRF